MKDITVDPNDIDGGLAPDASQDKTGVVVGADIGGTSIKLGLVTPRGNVLATGSIPTGTLTGTDDYERVSAAIAELAQKGGVEPQAVAAIGIDVPGVVLEDGTMTLTPNIELNLAGLLAYLRAAYPSANLRALNDANAAAYGEAWLGAGDGANNAVMLTLGTGVGGGIITGGNVLVGVHGAAGEVGHINVNPHETESCGCGCKGCLEQYASARGLIRLYREECEKDGAQSIEISHATDALAVFNAAHDGNEQAIHACERLGDYLARAMSIIAAVVDPESFILGGGMCGGYDTFGKVCEERFREYAINSCKQIPIRVATLGNTAGFLGAARAALATLE